MTASSPLDITTKAQRAAANPVTSAFVAANAGSGKTRVLTNRVARLLLAETPPQKILCITFTKAAAAEMAKRLFDMLGEWALADDATLNAALNELEGDEPKNRHDADLALARRLFARALETPGGLKIQTIHSFCESVLKRFPLEAGVAPGFSVIEDADATALAALAVDKVASGANTDIKAALTRLASTREPETLRALLIGQTTSRQKTEAALEGAGGLGGGVFETARALSVEVDTDERRIRDEALTAISNTDMERALAAIKASGSQAQKLAGVPIKAFLNATDPDDKWAALTNLFLTGGAPRKQIGDKQTEKADPWARPFLSDAQNAFVVARERVNAARIVADTQAFLTLLKEIWTTYDALKTSRAVLDYDDLISRTRRLFQAQGSAWVLFKLDQGLDHVLLDEAQDTSPAQWSVIEAPLVEFFAGETARDKARTFFAVGDQKQSIYSFQGADASLFQEKREDLGKRISAVAPYVSEPLTLSFRTTAPVLSFVDALFADPDARQGLWEDPLEHGVHRAGQAGLVELWPLTPRPENARPNPWDAPLDSPQPESPARQLASQVAATVQRWINTGEKLESKGSTITAGDVLILVQSRGPLFHEVIRALGEHGVQVAGADRLELLKDPAIEDILAYARTVLLETDDLSLAEVLKSPFFGFDDDALYDLAYGREGSLWRALVAGGEGKPAWKDAAEQIQAARKIAIKEGAYAFLTHILETGSPSGRSRLYARLGAASHETIDELLRQSLDYELKAPRSLQGFFGWITAHAGEIKREMDQSSGAARVMTVHGAKGLEAPIVFLLDAHRSPNTKNIGPLFDVSPDDRRAPRPRGVFALASTVSNDSAAITAAREHARRLHYEEYRRLLYVAATRAEDRLYVCGLERGDLKNPGAKPASEKTWHALSNDAFARLDNVERTPHDAWGGEILRVQSRQTVKTKQQDSVEAAMCAAAPDWLARHATPEAAPKRLAPSRLADDEEAALEPAAYSPAQGAGKYLRGRTLHRLLELLPAIDGAGRAASADRLLARLASDIDPDERTRWRDEVLAVLSDPAFASVFGPGSRAEVAIAGTPKGARSEIVISGQIDRLAVEPGRVLIVDYKTNRPPPARIEDAAPAYVAQLAAYRALLQEIYPGHQVEAGLLWTYEARLMSVPADMLDHAFARSLI